MLGASCAEAQRISVKVVQGRPAPPPAPTLPPRPLRHRPPKDFVGPPELAALSGRCVVSVVGSYEYAVCPFDNVTQRQLPPSSYGMVPPLFWGMLGVFEKHAAALDTASIAAGATSELHFTDGCPCAGGKRRRATVTLVCAEDGSDALRKVHEPQTCEYSMELAVPEACPSATSESTAAATFVADSAVGDIARTDGSAAVAGSRTATASLPGASLGVLSVDSDTATGSIHSICAAAAAAAGHASDIRLLCATIARLESALHQCRRSDSDSDSDSIQVTTPGTPAPATDTDAEAVPPRDGRLGGASSSSSSRSSDAAGATESDVQALASAPASPSVSASAPASASAIVDMLL